MKKLAFCLILSAFVSAINAQKSIDSLFEKYAGKDGFTTVTLSGNLCRLAACLDNDDEGDSVEAEITEIRILSQDDENLKVDNFYDAVISDIDLKNYEEFMRVKEKDQDLRILVRTEGRKFRELLLIAGGDDNTLIQVKGSMTLNDVRKLSNNINKGHGLKIEANVN